MNVLKPIPTPRIRVSDVPGGGVFAFGDSHYMIVSFAGPPFDDTQGDDVRYAANLDHGIVRRFPSDTEVRPAPGNYQPVDPRELPR